MQKRRYIVPARVTSCRTLLMVLNFVAKWFDGSSVISPAKSSTISLKPSLVIFTIRTLRVTQPVCSLNLMHELSTKNYIEMLYYNILKLYFKHIIFIYKICLTYNYDEIMSNMCKYFV